MYIIYSVFNYKDFYQTSHELFQGELGLFIFILILPRILLAIAALFTITGDLTAVMYTDLVIFYKPFSCLSDPLF